jgi:hypothetical protein
MPASDPGKDSRSPEDIELGNRIYEIRRDYGDLQTFIRSLKSKTLVDSETE